MSFRIQTPQLSYDQRQNLVAINQQYSTASIASATGTNIPVSALTNQAIVITPGTANQTYVLPTASAILSSFGVHSGISTLETDSIIPLQIINRSGFNATIVSNPTGGNGSAVIAYGVSTGAANNFATGAVVHSAHKTDLFVHFRNVQASSFGASGTYDIFH